MHSTLLCTIEWTPPYCVRLSGLHPTPCAMPYNQLFLTANSVNHGVDLLINALHPTPCYSVGSTLPIWLRRTAVPYSDHPLLNGLHPTLYYGVDSILRPCTAPYSYCLQWTKSAMEWTLFVVDSTLPLVLVLQLSLNDHLNTFVEPYTTCKTASCTCVWVYQVCICYA
jgi:hypothetical protein